VEKVFTDQWFSSAKIDGQNGFGFATVVEQ
jgi:hypothetical protein